MADLSATLVKSFGRSGLMSQVSQLNAVLPSGEILRTSDESASGIVATVSGMITNVTGSAAQGDTLTITGANLRQENTTGYSLYYQHPTLGNTRLHFPPTDGAALFTITGGSNSGTAPNGSSNFGMTPNVQGVGEEVYANPATPGSGCGPGFIDTDPTKALYGPAEGVVKWRSMSPAGQAKFAHGQSNNATSTGAEGGSDQHYFFRWNFQMEKVIGGEATNGDYFPDQFAKFMFTGTNSSMDINVKTNDRGQIFNLLSPTHPPPLPGSAGQGHVNHDVGFFRDNSRLVEGRWVCIEWECKRATITNPVPNGIFRIWVNGRLAYDADIDAWGFSENAGAYANIQIGCINALQAASPMQSWDYRIWGAGIVGKSGTTYGQRVFPSCQVEIANSADYNAATVRLWQHHVKVTETELQVTCELNQAHNLVSSGPSSGTLTGPMWLFVTNNSQTRSQAWAL